jgi:UDP-2,3-diacylglucosamine hydrolase
MRLMTTLFISDLHLDESRPAVTRAFYQFLENDASQAKALYILGDLFEVWVGDDDDSDLVLQTTKALKALSDSGVACFIMHGNRDFLIGQAFCKATGCTMLEDPAKIRLYGEATLLMHGDLLCIEDTAYLEWRLQCRSPTFQTEFLKHRLEQRRAIVAGLRQQSKDANSNKAEDIMDASHSEVVRYLEMEPCQRMIHGHTHRPNIHFHEANEKTAQRWVLGDWEQHFVFLTATAKGLELVRRAI